MTLLPGSGSRDAPAVSRGTRVFFALGPDPDALPGLLERQRDLLLLCRGRRIRTVRPENLHVTLAFLGDRTDEEIAGLITAARNIALPQAPIRARTGDVLALPHPERPRVVALELLSDGTIEHLAVQVAERTEAIGNRERRPFLAHLTLVRMNGGQLRPGAVEPMLVPLTTFALLASLTEPSGVRYEPLWSAELCAGDPVRAGISSLPTRSRTS